MRVGDCNQCGKCCEILFRCPFLTRIDEETSICSIYENRPKQCGSFPIDERCLAEVGFDCTYSFARLPQEEAEGLVLLQIDPVGSSD
jgi:Fe-S-cluster containining protein